MDIEIIIIGILLIGILSILLMIKQQLRKFKEELDEEWIAEESEKCGNCKHRYIYAENGKVIVRCDADYTLMPDGGHRMTCKRVRWDDAACTLYERREEEHDD